MVSSIQKCEMTINNKSRPGHPSMSSTTKKIVKICTQVLKDRCWTINKVEMLSGISEFSSKAFNKRFINKKGPSNVHTSDTDRPPKRTETCSIKKKPIYKLTTIFFSKVIIGDMLWL